MTKLTLTPERLWWLKKFGLGGWTIGHGMLSGVKKWDAHSSALVKMGLLETEPGYGNTYRITDAGRAALSLEQGEKP